MSTIALAARGLCAAALVALALTGCERAGGPETGPAAAADEPDPATIEDGLLTNPVPVDGDVPALTQLDSDLLAAVRHAAADGAADGVEILITSGWRSPEYQEQLVAEAVAEYGSPEEAARWVASPTASHHVSGAAVDVGRTDAAYWMSRHGSRYGLCQTYANEIWHYELATEPGGDCPPPLTDAAS